jgi:hypothetical protein
MSEPLVEMGPGSAMPHVPDRELDRPIGMRVLYTERDYDPATDEKQSPSPICRIDVLLDGVQRHIALYARRAPPATGTPITVNTSWLFEPRDTRAVSVQVDKTDLVVKLRALADEIEKL